MNQLLRYCMCVSACITGLFTLPVWAQDFQPNYDEEKVGEYKLPDPLLTASKKRITTAQQWTSQQRPVILNLFKEHVYGRLPGKTRGMYMHVNAVDTNALGGKAIRKEITIFFTGSPASPGMDVLVYLPKQAKGPVPVFVGLNYYGNHSIHPDPGISISNQWIQENDAYKIVNNKATEGSRGAQASRWPVEEILARGYGLATAYYGDLEPDHEQGWQTGIRTSLKTVLNTNEQAWGAIGAWAWGLSRIMDYLETDKDVNAKQVIITGHSRLGKAALWAAANDTRFAIVVSNNSGEGGTALARRNYGETIERINTAFPYWFNNKYKTYNAAPGKMPVDQHMLLALMAPRPLYVASAAEDQWADPKGEFLAAKHAEPVYALFGKSGLGVEDMPQINLPVGDCIRYHIRTGKHDITSYDWQQYLDFADKHFNAMAKSEP